MTSMTQIQLQLAPDTATRRNNPAKRAAKPKRTKPRIHLARGSLIQIRSIGGATGGSLVSVVDAAGRLFVNKGVGVPGYTVSDQSGFAVMQGIKTAASATKFMHAISEFSDARGDLFAQIVSHVDDRGSVRARARARLMGKWRPDLPREVVEALQRVRAFIANYDFALGKPKGVLPREVKQTPQDFASELVAILGRAEAEDYALEQATRNPSAFFVEVYASFLG
jgi:hypothetical protein